MSDLHIGKRVNGFSMVEDQKYILEKMTDIVKNESPDAVLIAGDIYDKTVPSAEAVRLLDDFIVELSALTAHVFIISGNHDSPERLAFGGRLMEKDGIHISPVYEGRVEPFVLEDSHGKVDIYMLPFIKPAHVRHAFPEKGRGDRHICRCCRCSYRVYGCEKGKAERIGGPSVRCGSIKI